MYIRTAIWQSEAGFTVKIGYPPVTLKDITDSLNGMAQVVKAPGQDGATTYKMTLGQPVINVTGSLNVPWAPMDEQRAALDELEDMMKRAFMPNRFGLLVDNRANGGRQIRCRPLTKPAFSTRQQGARNFDIEFVADKPMWESTTETKLDLGRVMGGFGFPLRLPTKMGTYYKDGYIDNPTGDDIYPIVEIYTTSEYVAVTNVTTGKKAQINQPIGVDQKMIIDMYNTRATLWQLDSDNDWQQISNVSNWLSGDSEYWALVPGMNKITLNNEIPGESVIATISFRMPV